MFTANILYCCCCMFALEWVFWVGGWVGLVQSMLLRVVHVQSSLSVLNLYSRGAVVLKELHIQCDVDIFFKNLGHLEMVRFLLEAGADQEHKTDEMHTALMEACMVRKQTNVCTCDA